MAKKQTYKRQNRPSDKLLYSALPAHIWECGEKQAKRSSIPHFSTGAVVFRDGEILGRGCSYHAETSSIHAEANALGSLPRHLTHGAEILIVTVFVPTGSWSYSSRPCARCAQMLHGRGIEIAHYAHRDDDGIWSIRTESVADLVERAADIDVDLKNSYARNMKVLNVKPLRITVSS